MFFYERKFKVYVILGDPTSERKRDAKAVCTNGAKEGKVVYTK
jgi:hypothetical protein